MTTVFYKNNAFHLDYLLIDIHSLSLILNKCTLNNFKFMKACTLSLNSCLYTDDREIEQDG